MQDGSCPGETNQGEGRGCPTGPHEGPRPSLEAARGQDSPDSGLAAWGLCPHHAAGLVIVETCSLGSRRDGQMENGRLLVSVVDCCCH